MFVSVQKLGVVGGTKLGPCCVKYKIKGVSTVICPL